MLKDKKFDQELTQTIREVLPDYTGNGEERLSQYLLDSFDLMSLRALLEEKLQLYYSDSQWVKIRLFSDFTSLGEIRTNKANLLLQTPNHLHREYDLNMPQLSLSGLSEYWYLKEIGDMHWRMVARTLNVPSDAILDEKGARLYATFVRIKFSATKAFSYFKENDHIEIESELCKFGNFYLSNNSLVSGQENVKSELVTSFVARKSKNTELYRSIPVEEVKAPIKNYTEMPNLIEGYHQYRKNEKQSYEIAEFNLSLNSKPLFECNYTLDPFIDLNGVGLLYFASYPHVFDICERQFFNQELKSMDWAISSATIYRDIFYFGNCDLNDRLQYKILDYQMKGNRVAVAAELIRQSDNSRVSLCVIMKEFQK